jgi:CTP synthase
LNLNKKRIDKGTCFCYNKKEPNRSSLEGGLFFIEWRSRMKQTKFIFVTGGVVSSLGKGINASSIGRLLKNRGLKVFMQKFDPYLNVDPGNMSPLQHGEVFVTDDGAETDLDLGHYERFIDENLSQHSSVTTGKIYLRVIEKERTGGYGGRTVQVIPHITNEIKSAICSAATSSNADVVITEIGGTVGDIESLPFLEAIRQVRRDIGYANTMYIHTTLVPYVVAAKELKTKPTQHSVKELRSIGINPDVIILRSEKPVPLLEKEKIALFCDVKVESVIEAKDTKYIYDVPNILKKQQLDDIICNHFGLETQECDMSEWDEMMSRVKKAKKEIKIALVGKYVLLKDAYLSVYEALLHGGYENDVVVKTEAINAEHITVENAHNFLSGYAGIIVPGGFGQRAIPGIINTIQYARENKIPFLGICLGMQLSLIEFARNALGHKEASSTEIDEHTSMPIIDLGVCKKEIGNPMRLGLYPCHILPKTKAFEIYKKEHIKERHRHRFEFNNDYKELFAGTELVFSGINPDQDIVEMIELNNHPWFVACQFHPEFLSRPNRAHPLFREFIRASNNNSIK